MFALFQNALVAVGLLGPVAASNSSRQWIFDEITPSKDLIWYPCETSLFCAKLQVPLDYLHPTGFNASVPLLKMPALANSTDGSYKGMVLYNPGGPGSSGVVSILNSGANLQAQVGTNYDFVGFDPRGMFRSSPLLNCSASSPSVNRRRSNPRFEGPQLGKSYFEQVLAEGLQLGQECARTTEEPENPASHMTTALNVRDMVSIFEAYACTPEGRRIENAGLVNFYGASYGTYIGETLASMFPERVGKVVLAGIADPEDSIHTIGLANMVLTDEVFQTFFIYCHAAGPARCPYYTGNTTRDIYNRFERSWLQLDAQHAAALNWTNATVIENTLFTAQTALFGTLYEPISYFPYVGPALVSLEAALSAQSLETWLEEIANITGSFADPNEPSPSSLAEWQPAVRCSDNRGILYNMSYTQLLPMIQEVQQESVIAGEIVPTSYLDCPGWPIRSDDVFSGPFGSNSSRPILFISNTLDPVTPITSARKYAPMFNGSKILVVDGTGHATIGPKNNCSNAKMKEFFQTGELPTDLYCPLEVGPFGIQLNETLAEAVARSGLPQ